MRKSNKKGFTIVELVIVIAVIAILAAVLIPTFSGVVDRAKDSAALQEATNAYKQAVANELEDGKVGTTEVTVGKFSFTWTNGSTDNATVTNSDNDFGYDVKVESGKVTVTKKN